MRGEERRKESIEVEMKGGAKNEYMKEIHGGMTATMYSNKRQKRNK